MARPSRRYPSLSDYWTEGRAQVSALRRTFQMECAKVLRKREGDDFQIYRKPKGRESGGEGVV